MNYGILFDTFQLGKRIILKTNRLIRGIIDDDALVDKYGNRYHLLTNVSQLNNNKKVFAFPVTDDQLKNYYKSNEYENYDYIDLCSELYKEASEQFIYVLEKNNEKTVCYAINLYNKESKKVKLNINLLDQLFIDNYGEKEKNDDVINENNININEVYNNITKRIIGQDEAVKTVVRTIARNLRYSDFEGMKSNILLYGPTGCGKTEIVRSIGKEFAVPVVIEDMTNYTSTGYVGDSVRNILKKLYIASDNDVNKTQHGIIMLDEFDKLATTNPREAFNKTDVQTELLRLTEGGVYNLSDLSKCDNSVMIDTSNITFIFGGAFSLGGSLKKNAIGFSKKSVDNMEEATTTDFKKYGIIPELLGRIATVVPVKPLLPKDLETILARSSISSLKIYEGALKARDNVRIVYTNKRYFISQVAKEAYELNVGARGLKQVIDKVFSSAIEKISMDNDTTKERELIISNEIFNDENKFVLKKVKREEHELPKRVRENYYKNRGD